MINRRNILSLMTSAVLSLLSIAPTVAQEVTLTMHQFLPAQANVPKNILDVWADKVESASGGRIKINRFPAMQLGGKPPQLIDQAIDGVADIIWTVNGFTPGRFPRTEVFELPFMMKDAESVSRAYYELMDSELKDTEFRQVHVLGAWVHGAGLFHTNKPVKELADLNGLKIRGASRMVNMLLSELGAQSIGMPLPAVPEALSKGVIDGTMIPWEVTPALKVPELVKNHTEFAGEALYTVTFVFAMNKARYNSLPDDLKKVIDDNSGMEFSAFAGATMEKYDAPAREIAALAGNNIVTLEGEQVEIWRKAAQPVYDKWIADMNAKGFDGAALVEQARAAIGKHEVK